MHFDRSDAGLSLYPIEREQDKATKLPVLKEITTEKHSILTLDRIAPSYSWR
jgi:hypothetical protein